MLSKYDYEQSLSSTIIFYNVCILRHFKKNVIFRGNKTIKKSYFFAYTYKLQLRLI